MLSSELEMVIDLRRASPPVPREPAWAEQRAALERIGAFLRPRWT